MNKILMLLLVFSMLLAGCGGEAADNTTADQSAPTIAIGTNEEITEAATVSSVPETTEILIANVTFEYLTEGMNEYACISGFDADGQLVWSHETDHYPMAQLERVSDVGQWERQYYYIEDGSVVALDVATGEVLWKNADFDGSPAGPDACLINEDGSLYLCGSFGPDFFAVDAQGNTLKSIPYMSDEYYWAYKLEWVDSQIAVYFSGGPEGDMGEPGYVFYVDPADFAR